MDFRTMVKLAEGLKDDARIRVNFHLDFSGTYSVGDLLAVCGDMRCRKRWGIYWLTDPWTPDKRKVRHA